MKLRLSLAAVVLCFFSATVSEQVFATPETPNMEELQRGWKMQAAKSVSGDDALVSQAGFDASKWYDIQRMPATVLQVLEDNGVYKDLYYGMNLTTPRRHLEARLVVPHHRFRARGTHRLLLGL
jgi:exo-1,4-beta-D-glucosaminidase